MRDTAKERIHGPYKHGNKWRLYEVATDGGRTPVPFATKGEAEKYAAAFRNQVEGRTLNMAVEAHVAWMDAKGLKSGTTSRAQRHLRSLLQLDTNGSRQPRWLTPKVAEELYEKAQTGYEVDSHRNALAAGRHFGKWAVKKGWLEVNPFTKVEPMGRRKTGKPQLRVDESRVLIDWCVRHQDDRGAVATLCCLLFGLRASELCTRDVRDLDDGGRLFWIPDSKTKAGKRTMEVPEVLRPMLLALAAGRGGTEPLFLADRGPRKRVDRTRERASRYWVYYHVVRVQEAAGLTAVPPHGLRGTKSSLAIQAHQTPQAVAASLGHASAVITESTYIDRTVMADDRHRAAMKVLKGGRS